MHDPLEINPTWYKDGVIYEMHVRAFYDSVTDGVGDFPGLTQKLDYLQRLGVTAIWLLPFSPSPLKDDGYDTSDYTDIHPNYGTLRDFHTFLKEAHRRGLRVITELVLNHTSDQHIWFQRSRRAAPGSRWRNFYVWSDTPDKYQQARIIFKDFESSNWTWDPVAKAYYWHRFYSHQPDLNFENPDVRATMMEVLDFWFDMGVDGLRLDAVPYLFEEEGTNCENLPQTHAFLRDLRRHVDEKYRDKMLLAEANQWPEDAVAYFGEGNESHMAFHFPLMPRLFMAMHMEDRYPVNDILRATPAIPETCQWALFLRNHDELTLEMVTDEERDYMYRSYANDRQARINLGIRRRLAPLLGNDRRKIELMNALLFSLPGTPVIYYGDEIGMGDNIYLGDRNGVRTPMQWSDDRNAGFSRANPQQLYLPVVIDPEYHYETVNVEAQQNNPHSLLWWMRRLIGQRKQLRAFGRGSLEMLAPGNRRVLAFLRHFQDEHVLVVANLSRFAQCAELDLKKFAGMSPIELFGRTDFPRIGENPYLLTLGPHAFYWFQLERQRAQQDALPPASERPVWEVASWEEVFTADVRLKLERTMPAFLRSRPWFQGKAYRIRLVEIADILSVRGSAAHILILRVEYDSGASDFYTLPLSVAHGEQTEQVKREFGQYVLAQLQDPQAGKGLLWSAIRDRGFADGLLSAILRRRRLRGEAGEVFGSHTSGFSKLWGGESSKLEPEVIAGDHNNSSIAYGKRLFLKLFRRLEPGPHPARQMLDFLSQQASFPHVPAYAGALEYRPFGDDPKRESTLLAMLQSYVPHEADGWSYTIDNLGLFFDRAQTQSDNRRLQQLPRSHLFSLLWEETPAFAKELVGGYLDMIQVLARRTAEMHLALASRPDIAEFAPEPFTDFYRQSLYHSMAATLGRCLDRLQPELGSMDDPTRAACENLLSRQDEIRGQLKLLRDNRIHATRTRLHGNYHLRDVLFTGKDWMIIDFEGDPRRPVGERLLKRSPIRDVAGMLRSLHYAAHAASQGIVPGVHSRNLTELAPWSEFWTRWVGAAFVREYLEVAGSADFVPRARKELLILLHTYLLEKALLEVEYELENRRDWLRIPVQGILDLLDFRLEDSSAGMRESAD